MGPHKRNRGVIGLLVLGVLSLSVFYSSFGNIASGSEVKKTIYLTFDDGPHPIFTPFILSLLDENGAKATFFPIGNRLEERWEADDLQDLLNRGHAIGNHSWSHRDLSKESENGTIFQLSQSSLITEKLAGFQPSCFRAPFGEVNQSVLEIGDSLGMKNIGWTVDPQEWSDTSVGKAMNHIVKYVEDEAIVLLHDRRFLTLPIVREIFKTFPTEEWSYETLPDCRNENEKNSRSVIRSKGDVPIGKVEQIKKVGEGYFFSGWAYDPDQPKGGLQVLIEEPNDRYPVSIVTDSKHEFEFGISNFEIEGPVCLWLKNEGSLRYNAFIGCHNAYN